MRRIPTSPSPRRASALRRAAAGGAGLAAVVALGLAPASPAAASPASLDQLVTTDAIRGHMENLQTIADYNGGNRATSTPGYDVAADYVIDQLKQAGYKPKKNEYEYSLWRQHSDAEFTRTAPDSYTYTEDEEYAPMTFSAAGDVTAPGVPVAPDASNSGCEAGQFDGFPEGAVAVIRRGACSFAQKTQNAADAGASAAVVFNSGSDPSDPATTELFYGTLGEESEIPALSTSLAVGEELVATEGLELRVLVDASVVTETSYNIIADAKGGAKDNVVVAGAHLDSVPEGSGMNDNASGSASLLETALQYPELDDKPKNKVRFAWWGTEEQGLIGSTKYVEGLSPKKLDRIGLYLNFDMLGSPNYGLLVYDGRGELPESDPAPSGSGAIQKTFEDYFAGQNLDTDPTVLGSRSDHYPFMSAGVPVGGLFSGGDAIKTEEQAQKWGGTPGITFDPNYHTPEDDLDNISWESVDILSGGLAHSVETFSESTLPVNGKVRSLSAQGPPERLGDLWLR
ncbi:M28 family peptidase [Nocardiopsis suaedae]|uniref:M28 family peptidase n=1 Tax=Nocardiopsis suaedae TaxID=3018444 RepID=A0ABT4TJQ3_9ACTN|nr:M28 family peptidase [Nocardiopsis suaedae]MDA2804499.1 M28 family peptidase [Nocardiopsis suaedae]